MRWGRRESKHCVVRVADVVIVVRIEFVVVNGGRGIVVMRAMLGGKVKFCGEKVFLLYRKENGSIDMC